MGGSEIENSEEKNIYFDEDTKIEINVANIHSVKGQTHTATLYMESSYYSGYESQRLESQFRGKSVTKKSGKRVKQSAKMAYVGLSRPTHLLCFAVHRSRWEKLKDDIPKDKWEIVQ